MVLPNAIVDAAKEGDVAAIAAWLDTGGDVNEATGPSAARVLIGLGRTLLHVVAGGSLGAWVEERGRCDIARLLLARGAMVDAIPIQIHLPGAWMAGEWFRGKQLSSAQKYASLCGVYI
jgi:hypothetical protein